MFAALVASCVLVFASDLRAEGEEAAPREEASGRGSSFELAAKTAYLTPPIRGGLTPFGAGFGARGGFAFTHWYLGATGTYYLGGSDVDVSQHAIVYGGELGYGFRIDAGGGFFTVRPQVGLGGVALSRTDPSSTTNGTTTTTSSTRGRRGNPDVVSGASSQSPTTWVHAFFVEPGLLLMYSPSGSVFFGASGSALFVPSIAYSGSTATWLSYAVAAQLGLHL